MTRATPPVPRVALAFIILAAIAISAAWSLKVPFLQETDEQAHADYIYRLYEAGGWFSATDPPVSDYSTPQVRYLAAVSNFLPLRSTGTARAPAGYGTNAYFRGVDAGAPKGDAALAFQETPYLVYNYPVAYYALIAQVMKFAGPPESASLVRTFFLARWTGTALLAPTLLLCFGIFRKLRFDTNRALALTAAIGFLPLTSWFSSSIQPDNAVLLLMTLFFYNVLRWRAQPFAAGTTIPLVAGLCALYLVKPHYALVPSCALALLFAGEIATRPVRRKRELTIAACSLAALGAAYSCAETVTPIGKLRLPPIVHALAAPHAGRSIASAFSAFIEAAVRGFVDVFFAGSAFETFWLRFGDFVSPYVRNDRIDSILSNALTLSALLVFGLFVIRQIRVWAAIAAIGRSNAARALKLATGDVFLNTYAIWSILILGVYAESEKIVYPEGRYFLPVIIPAILLGTARVPRLFTRRRRHVVSGVFVVAWCAFAMCSAPVAYAGMTERFYSPSLDPQHEFIRVGTIRDGSGRAFTSRVMDAEPGTTLRVGGKVYFEDARRDEAFTAAIDGRPIPIRFAPGTGSTLGLGSKAFSLEFEVPEKPGEHTLKLMPADPAPDRVGDELQITVTAANR